MGKEVKKRRHKSRIEMFQILNWKDINYYLTLKREQQYHYCARFKSLFFLGQIQEVEPTEPLVHSLYSVD